MPRATTTGSATQEDVDSKIKIPGQKVPDKQADTKQKKPLIVEMK